MNCKLTSISSRKRLYTLVGAATLAAVSISGMAVAEEGKTAKRGLEEIIVSARRTAESLQETPVSVVAVTGDDLENMGVTNIDSLDAFIPNVSTGTGMGNSGWASFSIRGIGGGQGWIYQESGVGVYIDDVYYPRANGALLDVVDVAQIEILRGPQGTLFGRNTTGGAIRYVTAKPEREFGGKITGAIGTYDRRDITGVVNLPLTDQLSSRFTFASKSRDGFIKNQSTGVYSGNSDVEAARAQFRWQNDTVDWNLSFDVLETSNDGVARDIPYVSSSDIFVGNFPGYTTALVTSDPYTVAGGLRPDSNTTESFGITNTVEFDLAENLTMKSITGMRNNLADSWTDWDLSPINVAAYDKKTTFDNWSQEFQFNGKLFDDRLDLVTGLFYMNETAFHEETSSSETFPPYEGRYRSYDIDTSTVAVFGQGSFNITDDLRATLGLRWSEDDKEIVSRHSGFGQRDDKWVLPRFYGRFKDA